MLFLKSTLLKKISLILCGLLVITTMGACNDKSKDNKVEKKEEAKIEEPKETNLDKTIKVKESFFIIPNSNEEVRLFLPENIADRLIGIKDAFGGELPDEFKNYPLVILDKEVYEKTKNVKAAWVVELGLTEYYGKDSIVHIGAGQDSFGTFEKNGKKMSLYCASNPGYYFFREDIDEEDFDKINEDVEAISNALYNAKFEGIKRDSGIYMYNSGEVYEN